LKTEHTHKFCVPIHGDLGPAQQHALERLMLREWIRLIDVSYVANMPGVHRVFVVTAPALEWMAKQETASI
jgi:hypothetical protein